MSRAFSIPWARWALYVVPAAALVLPEQLHPNPLALGSVYQSVSPVVDWWIQLHLLFVLLFALLGFALLVSLDGQRGVAATAARVMIGIFVAVTNAFVGTEGIGMGLVIRGAEGLPAAQQAGVEQAVQSLWDGFVAHALGAAHAWSWILAIGLTAMALYPTAQRRLPLVLVGAALLWFLVSIFVLPLHPAVWLAGSAALWVAIVAVVGSRDRTVIGPFGLLMLAILMPQHGAPVASPVGAVSVGVALLWRDLSVQPLARRAAHATPHAAAQP